MKAGIWANGTFYGAGDTCTEAEVARVLAVSTGTSPVVTYRDSAGSILVAVQCHKGTIIDLTELASVAPGLIEEGL